MQFVLDEDSGSKVLVGAVVGACRCCLMLPLLFHYSLVTLEVKASLCCRVVFNSVNARMCEISSEARSQW